MSASSSSARSMAATQILWGLLDCPRPPGRAMIAIVLLIPAPSISCRLLSAISRSVLPGGLRVLSERMPHVRSVSVGVWLARGSRHESAELSGIAHFVEHMLFKGTATRSAEDIAQTIDSIGGQMDAFTSKEYAGYYLKVLDEHLPLAVDVLSDIVTRPAFAARGHRAREEGDPRRDQDGRGHARRSGPRDLHREPVAGPSAGTADPRHARDGERVHARDAAPLLHRHLHGAESDRRRGRQHRARAGAGPGVEGVRGHPVDGIRVAETAAAGRARG